MIGIKSCNLALRFCLASKTAEDRYDQILLKGNETGWAAMAPNIILDWLSGWKVCHSRQTFFKAHQNPYLVGSCVGHLFGEITNLFSKAGLGYSFAFGNTTMGFRQSHLPTSFHFLLLITAHYTWQHDNDRQGNYFNIISFPLTYTSFFFNQISEV